MTRFVKMPVLLIVMLLVRHPAQVAVRLIATQSVLIVARLTVQVTVMAVKILVRVLVLTFAQVVQADVREHAMAVQVVQVHVITLVLVALAVQVVPHPAVVPVTEHARMTALPHVRQRALARAQQAA